MDIEDSDEEQGIKILQTNIFNEISSPPNLVTFKLVVLESGLLEQQTSEQLIMHTTNMQPEQMIVEHTTDAVPEQTIAEQTIKQPTAEKTTISSAIEPLEPFSAEQPTEPAATVEDLLKIMDIIKARRAAARAQSGSATGLVERQSITPEPALRPKTTTPFEAVLESSPALPKETTPSDMALGN